MMSFFPEIIRKVDDARIYLTFDDGPDKDVTPHLLELLKSLDIRASFFVIGQKVEQLPEIVQQTLRDGHVIGNHSYSHPRLLGKSREVLEQELTKADAAIHRITNGIPKLFRPPYGLFNANLLQLLNRRQRSLVLWSASAKDYLPSTPEEQAVRLERIAKAGRILLLHDGHRFSFNTLRALERALPKLKRQGLQFAPLPETSRQRACAE